MVNSQQKINAKNLMPVAWNWCMPGDEKKGIEPILTDKNQYKVGR